jgi:hypothetical protein
VRQPCADRIAGIDIEFIVELKTRSADTIVAQMPSGSANIDERECCWQLPFDRHIPFKLRCRLPK